MELLKTNRNIEIRGSRVILKPITENEINDRYLAWLNDSEINEYLEVRFRKQTIKDIYNYINNLRSTDGGELFAIFDIARNLHIGNCSITHFNPNNNGYAIYGLMIGEKDNNMGFAIDVEIMIVEYLLSLSEIRKIKGSVYAINKPAWKILEMLGFKKEGVLRKQVVLSDGTLDDGYVYGLFKEEWNEHKLKNKTIKYFLKNMKIINID